MLIIISSNTAIENEAEKINKLFKNGMQQFNIRKKTILENELRALLLKIDKIYHAQIVLHQHLNLVFELNLKGFHFNKNYPYNKVDAEKLKTDKRIIGISSHSTCSLGEYEYLADYQFISPIYNSISKPGYLASKNLEEIKNYLTLKPKCEIIALGGITDKNVFQTLKMRFFGVASLGFIWQAEERYLKYFFNLKEEYDHFFSYKNFLKDD